MNQQNERFPEQNESAKVHGTDDPVPKMKADANSEEANPENEGHVKEWQDRARVVLDAKEAAQTEASPKQSPLPGEDMEDVEEKSKNLGRGNDNY